jgi:hypothetical protein
LSEADRLRQPETLYNGHDIANAAAASRVHRSLADSLAGATNGLAILGGLVARRLSAGEPAAFELVTATGKVAGNEAILTAVYAGTGINRAWCLSSVFDEYEATVVASSASRREINRRLAEKAGDAGFIFADGIGGEAMADAGLNALALPAWVKQRLRVQPDWQLQLKSMRRGTRQETARVLRKRGYVSRLTTDRSDFESFYVDLYKPYATRRFGEGVLLVDRPGFMSECRRGILLQLDHRQSVVGASLLRRTGNSLAIVWSALEPRADADVLRGATDALDYFSLLYAQLKGCRWLDFGPSRPDLDDGALRYKRKWGTEVTAGLVPQASIYLALSGRSCAEQYAIQGKALILKGVKGLYVAAFVAANADPDALRSKVAGLIVPGIDAYRLVSLGPLSDNARAAMEEVDSRVVVIEATSVQEAIAAARC